MFVGEKDGVEIKADLGTDAALQPGFLRRSLAEDLQRLPGEAFMAVGDLQLLHWPGRQDGQGVVWVFGVVQVPVAINIRRPNRDGAQRLQHLGHCRAAQRCVFAACLGGEALHFRDIIHGADAACLQIDQNPRLDGFRNQRIALQQVKLPAGQTVLDRADPSAQGQRCAGDGAMNPHPAASDHPGAAVAFEHRLAAAAPEVSVGSCPGFQQLQQAAEPVGRRHHRFGQNFVHCASLSPKNPAP